MVLHSIEKISFKSFLRRFDQKNVCMTITEKLKNIEKSSIFDNKKVL